MKEGFVAKSSMESIQRIIFFIQEWKNAVNCLDIMLIGMYVLRII